MGLSAYIALFVRQPRSSTSNLPSAVMPRTRPNLPFIARPRALTTVFCAVAGHLKLIPEINEIDRLTV